MNEVSKWKKITASGISDDHSRNRIKALAINSVFDASGMVTGGFSGIAIIIKAGSQGIIDGGIPLWVTNMGLNIPLFLIGWKINGFSFVKKALIGEIARPPGLP